VSSQTNKKQRCAWVEPGNELYERYHDEEWGVPVHDDRTLFEFLLLEGAQAGLSWLTILKKRENYRKAFADFQPEAVAAFTARDMRALLRNAGIVRNRLKIKAAITNAQKFLLVQQEFGSFDAYQWAFVGGKPIQNARRDIHSIPAVSPEAEAFSKDLKQRGFVFVGPTIVYAHMQAVGMVNDHTTDCFRYKEVQSL
jgi:DNA-3-methyladenine glycosylase I